MSENILIVDDDEDFRREFRECLEEHDVRDVPSGEEALRILKKPNEIDLVVLDVRMPGMGGIEAMKRIKKLSPDINIIVLTGYGSKDVAVEALKLHADDYLEKPVDVDRARRVINEMLESRSWRQGGHEGVKGRIERIKRFMERNSGKKVSLKDAAQLVYISPKYLSRIFKNCTGLNFCEYKLNVKMERAKALLKETGCNIDEIGEKLGYMNTESFIRQFKKIAHCTPTQYRGMLNSGRGRAGSRA